MEIMQTVHGPQQHPSDLVLIKKESLPHSRASTPTIRGRSVKHHQGATAPHQHMPIPIRTSTGAHHKMTSSNNTGGDNGGGRNYHSPMVKVSSSVKENEAIVDIEQAFSSRLMQKPSYYSTPNKSSEIAGNRYLNPTTINFAINQKIHPMHLVRAAANRAKMNSEQKKEHISRLELQKETIKHLKERNAQDVFVLDAPKTRAQQEREAFMQKSNIKNNILSQEDQVVDMSLQPNKFNLSGWEYKKMSDIKLRSNLVKDHLNGKYCGREFQSKKDAERYRPQKIFKSMYNKVHVENSRNKVRGIINASGDENTPTNDYYDEKQRYGGSSKYQTVDNTRESIASKQRSGAALMDLLYRQTGGLEAERDLTIYPKNDYAPPFVSSLNFNFNMNDVFGSNKQGSVGKPPVSSLKNENKSLTDVLGGMKKQLDSQRQLLASALNNNNSLSQTVGSKSVQHVKTVADKKHFETALSPKTRVGESVEGTSEELKALRRRLNNHILKNEYSFWAGMYVKRLPNSTSGGPVLHTAGASRPSLEETLLKKKQDILENLNSQAYYPAYTPDSRNQYRSTSSTGIPLVDFGDPRSLTQCINFNRKKLPYLPEQEIRTGGGTKLIAPPPKQPKQRMVHAPHHPPPPPPPPAANNSKQKSSK